MKKGINKSKGINNNEYGQGLVEFALLLPILLLLLIGIIEFGWIFNAKITITSAAREGARVAVVSTELDETAMEEKVRETVKESLKNSGVKIIDDDIDIVYSEEVENIVVSIDGAVNPIVGLIPAKYLNDSGDFPLSSSATMRDEN